MEEEQFERNLKISIWPTENGILVKQKIPVRIDYGVFENKTQFYSFETNYDLDDYHSSFHCHIGRVIEEAAIDILNLPLKYGYNIEIILTQKTKDNESKSKETL